MFTFIIEKMLNITNDSAETLPLITSTAILLDFEVQRRSTTGLATLTREHGHQTSFCMCGLL